MSKTIQFNGSNTKECCLFVQRNNISACGPGEYISVYTPDGPVRCEIGDWIEKRDDGQLFVHKTNAISREQA